MIDVVDDAGTLTGLSIILEKAGSDYVVTYYDAVDDIFYAGTDSADMALFMTGTPALDAFMAQYGSAGSLNTLATTDAGLVNLNALSPGGPGGGIFGGPPPTWPYDPNDPLFGGPAQTGPYTPPSNPGGGTQGGLVFGPLIGPQQIDPATLRRLEELGITPRQLGTGLPRRYFPRPEDRIVDPIMPE